jgi:hypothetical protein
MLRRSFRHINNGKTLKSVTKRRNMMTCEDPYYTIREKPRIILKNVPVNINLNFIGDCCERNCIRCVFSPTYDPSSLYCCGKNCEYCKETIVTKKEQ